MSELLQRLNRMADSMDHVAQQLRDVDREPQRGAAYANAARWLREALDHHEHANLFLDDAGIDDTENRQPERTQGRQRSNDNVKSVVV